MTHQTEPLALLRDTEHYLSALHGSVARHDNLAANYGCAGCELRDRIAAAVSAAVAPPTQTAVLPPAATCSAQYHGPGEDQARLCIRAAQHQRTAHTDEHGFHWSDTVATYPVADGTFRTGTNVRAELRRMADETATEESDGARLATLETDLADGPVRCPLCPTPLTLHTPSGARAHFTTVHPEQRITGRESGPWPLLVADETATETPFTPHAHYRRDDSVDCCVHAIPVGPDSCQACRELADEQPASGPTIVDQVVAALQAKAQALSVEAEEEMRRDLEEQAQVWHEAADLARRTGKKTARNAQPAAGQGQDGNQP